MSEPTESAEPAEISEPAATGTDLDEEAVVLVGHGSRRERSNEQVRELAAGLESRLEVPVDAAFLELAEPAIGDSVAELAAVTDRITAIHCSLFAGTHVKTDVPLAIEQARAAHDVEIDVGAHLGIHPSIIDLLDDRAHAVERELGIDRDRDEVAVVLCARGSSDPDANADVHKLSRLLYEGRSFARVEASFVGVTDPVLEETLHGLSKHRPDAVVVLPYMLGDGVLTERVREWTASFEQSYPYVDAGAGEPLGTDSRLLDVFADRFQEARSDSVEMSCDTCKYKVDLAGYETDTGGARAMLRALLHQADHADREDIDAEPHAHDAPEKHVAVCTNRTCSDDGAHAVLEGLRQSVRDSSRADAVITRSSCLGRCGEGPMVAVYPDGVWYGDVEQSDTDRIVSSHLDRDRIVSDIVDQTL